MAYEDDNDWCDGWVKLPLDHPNCSRTYKEFEYTSAGELKSITTRSGVRDYGGGGYILELRGFIDDLKEKIRIFKEIQWVNNSTRSAILEFSVYNAQVNIFSTVTCVAEFIGGGIVPWYRIETLRYGY